MKITLLDALEGGELGAALRQALASETLLADHRLREERFAPCQGCFECWVKHPGTCKAKDAANDVMRDAMAADALFWATRVRFGCWDPIAKVAFDKAVGVLSPFFRAIAGETHHAKRYARYPRMGVLAVLPTDAPPGEAETFRRLVARNAANFHAGAPWVGFVREDDPPEAVRAALAEGLDALRRPRDETLPKVAAFAEDTRQGAPPKAGPRHVVLWVGSAKPAGASTSEALAGALEARLVDRGWTSERVHALRTTKLGQPRAPKLVDAARRADLLVLASPVYIDCLPSLVLAGLGHLVDAALDPPPALLPIIQCGFPELEHTALALEVVRRAARALGAPWAGHLALGGAGAIQADHLERAGRMRHQVDALDQAAEALNAGRPLPIAASERFATPLLGPRAYRAVGQVGWVVHALKEGSALRLWDRPLAPEEP